jgi:cytochrome c oxidase assembly protein subunit 15
MDSPTARPPGERAIAAWLLACCAMVFAMIVVGGMTRLTHSGLSIVEWQPIVGAVPPLDDSQWEETFAKYRETPEYRLRNHDMTLEGFKGIFWWEYAHRLLGRVIGLVFFLPFLWFIARRRIPRRLAWPLAGIFTLGALQGAVGWFMVKSGLVDDPRVSFVMVLSGALVAAIHAGYAYNTFPLMDGNWIPPEILMIDPWWMNFVHNMATVQFVHRTIAIVIAVSVALVWWRVRMGTPPGSHARTWAHALAVMAAVQICVGIATLLLRAPLPLAAIHQAGAVLVFTCAVGLAHALRAKEGLQP